MKKLLTYNITGNTQQLADLVAGDNVTIEEESGDIVISASGGSDVNYVYQQSPASSTWHITHNLGKNPSVSIVDSAGTNVIGHVNYINNNELILEFKFAFAGKAFLN